MMPQYFLKFETLCITLKCSIRTETHTKCRGQINLTTEVIPMMHKNILQNKFIYCSAIIKLLRPEGNLEKEKHVKNKHKASKNSFRCKRIYY